MKTQVEKISPLGRKLNIEIPASIVQSTFDRAYKQVQSQAQLKGFRPGKAPIQTIKSVYGDRINDDVLKELLQLGYSKGLVEHNLEPINYPNFEYDPIHDSKPFSFSAELEIRPEVVINNYEGLDLTKEIYVYDESQLEKVLNNIRTSRATLEDIKDNRAAQLKDIAVIDFEGFVDGKPLENGKGENHNLELGSNQFIPGFEAGIVGMSIGEEKTLNLHFPTPYQAKELDGKAVEFKVKLTALKIKVLPELNDDFVKSLGDPGSLEELKNEIRADIERSEQKRIAEDLRNHIITTLIQNNPVEVPPSLLKEQKEVLIENFKKQNKNQGMVEAEFEEHIIKWDKDFEKTASQMIQSSFIINAIANKHDLNWTKEDLDTKFKEYSAEVGIELARIKKFYNRPEQMQRLTHQITEDKVMNFLISKANIKNISKSSVAKNIS
jgi:trigger factor